MHSKLTPLVHAVRRQSSQRPFCTSVSLQVANVVVGLAFVFLIMIIRHPPQQSSGNLKKDLFLTSPGNYTAHRATQGGHVEREKQRDTRRERSGVLRARSLLVNLNHKNRI